ncbi:MAG: succinylglutamate desuccinylase/aspartoacylase family protein [Betaproteobacteria bacterium]|nr:succinylglutamate desuccinylase/aspartoacylase family protein [Betaproteobacteria bacterium]
MAALPDSPPDATTADQHHFHAQSFQGQKPGPRLIVLGAVHGNETCGTQAIRRILAELKAGTLAIAAGRVTFVPITNPLAYAKRERNGERNLNRNLGPVADPHDFEDRIANWLCPMLADHDVLLDLHSTRAQNGAFAMLGPRNNEGSLQPFKHEERERALARHLGVDRFVDGWLDTYAHGVARRMARVGAAQSRADILSTDPRYGVGTTEYMRSVGGSAITLECGQHEDARSPEVGYHAIRNTLAFLGLSGETPPPAVGDFESLSLVAVHDREHEGDSFAQPWASFNRFAAGDLIARRHDGTELTAPAKGCIMFPDAHAKPGNEWFYFAKENPRGQL